MALLSCTSRMTVDMPCGMAWSQFETVITMENLEVTLRQSPRLYTEAKRLLQGASNPPPQAA